MQRIRKSGPASTQRPFVPAMTADTGEQIADALESIAVSLAAIDHNLELAVSLMRPKTLKDIRGR